jgi:[ribosomal protein S18]-alanine N-acetyltransferase
VWALESFCGFPAAISIGAAATRRKALYSTRKLPESSTKSRLSNTSQSVRGAAFIPIKSGKASPRLARTTTIIRRMAPRQRILPRLHANSFLQRRIFLVPPVLRPYDSRDFSALFRLDQSCFPPGISYSKTTLRYFLSLRSADCLIAMEDTRIAGFILTEENPPLAHIITLDVAEKFRRRGFGSALLFESEGNLARRGVRTVLLETAATNETGVAFWQHHGYRIEATLKRYYLGKLDAYEMRKILAAPTKSASATIIKHGISPGENL